MLRCVRDPALAGRCATPIAIHDPSPRSTGPFASKPNGAVACPKRLRNQAAERFSAPASPRWRIFYPAGGAQACRSLRHSRSSPATQEAGERRAQTALGPPPVAPHGCPHDPRRPSSPPRAPDVNEDRRPPAYPGPDGRARGPIQRHPPRRQPRSPRRRRQARRGGLAASPVAEIRRRRCALSRRARRHRSSSACMARILRGPEDRRPRASPPERASAETDRSSPGIGPVHEPQRLLWRISLEPGGELPASSPEEESAPSPRSATERPRLRFQVPRLRASPATSNALTPSKSERGRSAVVVRSNYTRWKRGAVDATDGCQQRARGVAPPEKWAPRVSRGRAPQRHDLTRCPRIDGIEPALELRQVHLRMFVSNRTGKSKT